MKHSLSDIDLSSKEATCSLCGPTKAYRNRVTKAGTDVYICRQTRNKTKTEYQKRLNAKRKAYRLELLKAQEYQCAICSTQLDDGDLDHCHTTDNIRAVLCGMCNKGIGHFLDKPALLRKAADYIEAQTNRTDERHKYQHYMFKYGEWNV